MIKFLLTILCCLLLFLIGCNSTGSNQENYQSLPIAIPPNKLLNHFQLLSSDTFQGRKVSTEGNLNAQKYIIQIHQVHARQLTEAKFLHCKDYILLLICEVLRQRCSNTVEPYRFRRGATKVQRQCFAHGSRPARFGDFAGRFLFVDCPHSFSGHDEDSSPSNQGASGPCFSVCDQHPCWPQQKGQSPL